MSTHIPSEAAGRRSLAIPVAGRRPVAMCCCWQEALSYVVLIVVGGRKPLAMLLLGAGGPLAKVLIAVAGWLV